MGDDTPRTPESWAYECISQLFLDFPQVLRISDGTEDGMVQLPREELADRLVRTIQHIKAEAWQEGYAASQDWWKKRIAARRAIHTADKDMERAIEDGDDLLYRLAIATLNDAQEQEAEIADDPPSNPYAA